MFGIGLAELAVIAFFGVLVLGPDKIPGLASQAAQALKAAKRLADGVRDDLRDGLGEDYQDLELRDLHPRELVRRQLSEAMASEQADTTTDPVDDTADEYDEDYDGPRHRAATPLHEGKTA